jgi:hypothetical protein
MIKLIIDPELEDQWRQAAEFHLSVFVGVASSVIRHIRLNISSQSGGGIDEPCVCELNCDFYHGIKSHHRVVDIEKNRAMTSLFSQARRQLQRNSKLH